MTYEILTQDRKTFHELPNGLVPDFPTETLYFLYIQFYNEQKPEIFLDSDTKNTSQNHPYTSKDNSQFDDTIFDEDPIHNSDDTQSNTANLDDKLYKL